MSTAAIVLIAIIAAVGLTIIGMLFFKNRKGNKDALLEKIRPIITEVVILSIDIIKADKMGYDALENYAVKYIKGKVDASDFLTDLEKELLSESLIRGMIGPILKGLYPKK